MHAEYGKQVGQAFAAVCQLHKDVSRLLADTAPRLGPGRVNDTFLVPRLNGHIGSPDSWMPYYVNLFSRGDKLSVNEAESLTVYFWDYLPKPQEPHLILAKLLYRQTATGVAKSETWDGWDACFEWGQPFPVGVVNRFSPPDHDRVESVSVTAVPLFDIATVDDVLKLMATVRAAG